MLVSSSSSVRPPARQESTFTTGDAANAPTPVSAYTIYQAAFVYLSECYGSHASSAVAAMSFLRIILGSSFPMFTNQVRRRPLFLLIGIPRGKEADSRG